jgi:Cd2+/Zn2+-exporting ATPase
MTNKNHIHTYDEHGKMTCCSLEEKINTKADEANDQEHDHSHAEPLRAAWKEYLPAIVSFVLLLLGIVFDQFIQPNFLKETHD